MRHGRVREDSFMKNIVLLAATLSAVSGLASASSVTIDRDSGQDALTGGVSVFGIGRIAGHIGFAYNPNPAPGTGAGQFASGSFATFCLEIDQSAGSGTYQIVDVAAAPNPTGGANPNQPNSYGSIIAGRIGVAVKAGILANWIGSDLSLISSGNATTDNERMAAIQAAVWEAIYDTGAFSNMTGQVVTTTGGLNARWTELSAFFGNNGVVAGLRGIVNANRQDQLYIVPLPPAAFAGLATLVGVAGVARLRRR